MDLYTNKIDKATIKGHVFLHIFLMNDYKLDALITILKIGWENVTLITVVVSLLYFRSKIAIILDGLNFDGGFLIAKWHFLVLGSYV